MASRPARAEDVLTAVGLVIKEIRENRKLSERQLAVGMKTSESRISKIQNGQLKVSDEFIKGFDGVVKLTEAERRRLENVKWFFEGDFKPWGFSKDDSVKKLTAKVAEIEAGTKVFQGVHWFAIPPWLWTEDYAKAFLQRIYAFSGEQIQHGLNITLDRRSLLDDASRSFRFIVFENAFWIRTCPPDIMLRQLEHVRDLLSSHSNLTLLVISFDQLLPRIPVTSFMIYEEYLVRVGTQSHALHVYHKPQVDEYMKLFNDLSTVGTSVYPVLEEAMERCKRLGGKTLPRSS